MISVAEFIEVYGGDVDVDAVERAARCSRCKAKSITSTQIIYVGSSGSALQGAEQSMAQLKRFAFNLRHIQQPEGSSSILAD